MHKFNKKLTLNIPDETLNTHQNQSPSVNDITAMEKQPYYQLIDGMDSESVQNRLENSSKLNFLEFEEFNVDQPINKFQNRKQELNVGCKSKQNMIDHDKIQVISKHKRNVTIQLPDRDQQDYSLHKKKKKITTQQMINIDSQSCDDRFKQPPAPSKGSKQGKVFIFPGGNDLKKKGKTKDEQSIEELKQYFQRQRQQFYKQKSRLQQQILVKNGQIDMLQKIVKDKYSPTNSSNSNKDHMMKDIFQSQNYQLSKNKRHKQMNIEMSEMEDIILQKDLQISELLEKIAHLNQCLSKKTQQCNTKIMDNYTLQGIVQSLKNQLYIYEKKQMSDKLTNNFYRIKKQRQSREISRERDRDLNVTTALDRQWEDEQFEFSTGHRDFGTKGLINLQKRIENIHKNRVDLDHRSTKIKSEIALYPQSTRNRPKGAFDFNSRGLNKTRLF